MNRWRIQISIAVICALLIGRQANANFYSKRICTQEQVAKVPANAPAGLAEFVNDPLRRNAYGAGGSETPVSFAFYSFQARTTEEVSHLIQQLGRIHAPVRVELDPRSSQSRSYLPENGATAVFFQSSAAVVEKWLKEFAERSAGKEPAAGFGIVPGTWVKQWGARASAIRGVPYVLRIYIGSPAIKLDALEIPLNVELGAATTPIIFDSELRYVPQLGEEALTTAIDARIAAHQAKRLASGRHAARERLISVQYRIPKIA